MRGCGNVRVVVVAAWRLSVHIRQQLIHQMFCVCVCVSVCVSVGVARVLALHYVTSTPWCVVRLCAYLLVAFPFAQSRLAESTATPVRPTLVRS
jgi:hypothetical protein